MAFAGYLALQALIVVGLRTPRYPDSASYLVLSLIGSASRLPTVPLVYSVFPSDALRICAQVVLAAVSWWILAAVASSMVRDSRVKIGLRVVLLMLGVIGPIASWNSLILSESIAISLTALLVAVWLRYSQTANAASAAAAVIVTIFWTFTRQPHVIVGLLITAAAVISALLAPRDRIRVAVAVALVATSLLGFIALSRNQSDAYTNIAAIIQDRILTDPSRTAWFTSHGMPYSTTVAQSVGRRFYDVSPRADPQFEIWLTKHGLRTYLQFVVEHPGYALLDPLPYFSGERASLIHLNTSPFADTTQPEPTPSLLSPTADYGRHRDVLPTVVEELLFEPGQIGHVITLAAAAIVLTLLARRRFGPDPRILIPALAAASAIPHGYLVWLGSGEAAGELDRLSIVLAVSLRIGLWIVLALALDQFAVGRAARVGAAGIEPATSRV